MNKRTLNKLTMLFFLAAVVVLFFLSSVTWADGDPCKGHSCNSGDDIDIGLDASVVVGAPVVGGATNYATGLGDVDINDYYRSYQLLIWQGTQLNVPALAVYYDSIGLHAAAAEARCSVRGIRKIFKSEADCLIKNTALGLMTGVRLPPPTEVNKNREEGEEERAWREEQQQMYEDLAAKYVSLEQRPRVVKQTVVEKPWLSPEKRAKLQAVLDE